MPDVARVAGVSATTVAHVVTQVALGDPLTALVMGNDKLTINQMRRLVERGIRVPNEMSIVSFDDFPWADLFRPRLTAIRQPVEELGSIAVTMLYERMQDPEREARQVRPQAEFIARDSAIRIH